MPVDYTVQKETGPAFRDQMVNLCVSRMQWSEAYFSGIRQRLPRMYDLWRGVWTGRFHPHKNNVHVPLIYSAIWADAARKTSTSLGSYPLLTFLGYGPDDMPIARKQEALISAQMKDNDTYMKEVDTIVTADLYGVAITQVGWKREEPFRIIENIERSPLTGETIRTIRRGKVVTFDGPESEPVDRLDFFPQPAVGRLQNMKWVVRRRYVDLDDIRALGAADIFDKGEIRRMEAEGGAGYQATDPAMIKRFQVRTGMDEQSARWMDKYSRPVELLEMWGEVPSELTGDGVKMRVITVANRRYMMRNRPNPFWHGRLPFVAFSPNPDPHYFDAPGKAEVMEKVQIVANRYVNQSLDAADFIIDPMWFYDRAAGLNTRNLFARPGKFIPVDGDPNAVVSPMQANLSGITVANDKLNLMRDFAQMGSGLVEDAVQGLEGSDRQTAREFLGRREAAGTRLLLESRIYEEMYFEKMGNMFVANNKQFLEAPVEVTILGESATYDPVTGQPIQTTRATLTDYDLIPTYASRAMGATTGLSKSMRRDSLLSLLQTMGTPLGQAVMGSINVVNFWRSIFRDFEIPNINEIFQPVPNNPLAQMVQQATQGQGGVQNVPSSGQVAAGQIPQISGVKPENDVSSMLRQQS